MPFSESFKNKQRGRESVQSDSVLLARGAQYRVHVLLVSADYDQLNLQSTVVCHIAQIVIF